MYFIVSEWIRVRVSNVSALLSSQSEIQASFQASIDMYYVIVLILRCTLSPDHNEKPDSHLWNAAQVKRLRNSLLKEHAATVPLITLPSELLLF